MAGTVYTPEQMLARLVAFDTTSHLSNLALIDFVRDYLAGHGVDSQLVPNGQGDKASLFATIGPAGKAGIALSGHTDVVPAAADEWSSAPFAMTERGGRLYGRGTADMKGFVAVALALVPEMVAARLATPIHLVLSYDEEVGCAGVRPLIALLGEQLVRPRLVIVGEPTGMRVVDAHKSIHAFVTEVRGLEAHSSMIHQGANAILAAGEVIGEIARIRAEMIAAGDPSGRFTPPYTTIHVGRIAGGTANNIIPSRCVVNWEMRALPGADMAGTTAGAVLERVRDFARRQVEPGLKTVSPDTGIDTRATTSVPPLTAAEGCEARALALRLTGHNTAHAVSYATEAGLFQRAGVPAVICGPGHIDQAHQPDEYVDRDQLAACAAFLRRLIDMAN